MSFDWWWGVWLFTQVMADADADDMVQQATNELVHLFERPLNNNVGT
jgi:hypothetical protein